MAVYGRGVPLGASHARGGDHHGHDPLPGRDDQRLVRRHAPRPGQVESRATTGHDGLREHGGPRARFRVGDQHGRLGGFRQPVLVDLHGERPRALGGGPRRAHPPVGRGAGVAGDGRGLDGAKALPRGIPSAAGGRRLPLDAGPRHRAA